MITNKTYEEINVGDSASLERILTKRDVDMFAVMSGGMNPTHLSDEYAMLLERQKSGGHSMWGGTLISSLLGNDWNHQQISIFKISWCSGATGQYHCDSD